MMLAADDGEHASVLLDLVILLSLCNWLVKVNTGGPCLKAVSVLTLSLGGLNQDSSVQLTRPRSTQLLWEDHLEKRSHETGIVNWKLPGWSTPWPPGLV